MRIGGLNKLTLLDYPTKVACTVFTVGCNFRCPFCHNSRLVKCEKVQYIDEKTLFEFLEKRKNVLEGMCLTGGEPLLQSDIADFLRRVKHLGYCVKLDTNGSFPEKLRSLAEENLVDYVAMDVKNSKAAYSETVGVKVDLDAICRSVEFLKSGVVDYEFRTTVTGNHTKKTIAEMGQWLEGCKRLYLQKFEDSGELLDARSFGRDEETMREFRDILRKYVPETHLRGMEE